MPYETAQFRAGRGRYIGMVIGVIGLGTALTPLYYFLIEGVVHRDWRVPYLFAGVGLLVAVFGSYFAFSKIGAVIDPDMMSVVTWSRFLRRKAQTHRLGDYSRVCVATEYASSDTGTNTYYVVRLEGDRREDSLRSQYRGSRVLTLSETVAGLAGKAERFNRWASMNMLTLAQFDSHELATARSEAASIAALIDYPVVEDLDE
jgi:MFS family permease